MASLISLPPRLCASSIHRIVFLPRRPPASESPPSRSRSIAGFSFSAFSFSLTRRRPSLSNRLVGYPLQISEGIESSALARKESNCSSSKRLSVIPRCSSNDVKNESTNQNKTPFGYTRKDVLLIGVGVTVIGVGLKSGLEFYGVDPLQAGNVVQLVIVLGLTVGWISTYMFRVSNKEMTYAQQLRDYEKKVMEKRLESLSEAELAALLEQVEEEKQRISSSEQVN